MLQGNPGFLFKRPPIGTLSRRRSHGDQAVAFTNGPLQNCEDLECGQARDPVTRERAGGSGGTTT